MVPARPRLGQLLVDAGLILPEHLAAALDRQRTDPRRLGTLLVEAGSLNEVQLTQVLSQQLNAPWVSLYHIDFSRQLLNLVPREVAERFCLVPIYVRNVRGQGNTLYVAMDDPTNEEALRSCALSSRLPARAMIAPPSDIRDAIRVYYGASPAREHPSQPAISLPPDSFTGVPAPQAAAQATAPSGASGQTAAAAPSGASGQPIAPAVHPSGPAAPPRPQSVRPPAPAATPSGVAVPSVPPVSADTPSDRPVPLVTHRPSSQASMPPTAAARTGLAAARDEGSAFTSLDELSEHDEVLDEDDEVQESAPVTPIVATPASVLSASTPPPPDVSTPAVSMPAVSAPPATSLPPTVVAPPVTPLPPTVPRPREESIPGFEITFADLTPLPPAEAPRPVTMASHGSTPTAPATRPHASTPAGSELDTDQPFLGLQVTVPTDDEPGEVAEGPRPRMVSLTLLDGTTISLPARGKGAKRPRGMPATMSPTPLVGQAAGTASVVHGAAALAAVEALAPAAAPGESIAPPPGESIAPPAPDETLTARDLVSALRAVAHGADASEILGDNTRWEALFAALLSLLLRKRLIADWEFVEEFKKI